MLVVNPRGITRMLSPVDSSFSAHAAHGAHPGARSAYPPPALDDAAARAPVSAGVARMLEAANDPVAAAAPPPERTLVASEDSVQAGGVRDAYDLRMYREPDGSHTLELDMKVGMSFVEGPQGQQWTAAAQEQFKRDFADVVEGAWSGHAFSSDSGQQVTLEVNLDIVDSAADDGANWNVEVVKINDGEFNQSYVIPSRNTGVFDSGDVQPVEKGATDPQYAAAHEFGHMIGLPDEYNGRGGPEAQKDTDSIMHTGMDVRDRHMDLVESWVNANNQGGR